MSPVDVPQLRVFLAVAEELHFGRAARRLHLTVAPVSRAVRGLERELGVQLFIRRHHEVELTPAGHLLAQRGTRLLADLEELKGDVRTLAAAAPQVIRVGGTHRAPPRILDDVVACIEAACTNVTVEAVVASSGELIPQVRQGELDLAAVYLPVDEIGVDALPLARYRFSLAMRHDDPLAGAPSVSIADVADREVIVAAPDSPDLGHGAAKQLRAMGLRNLRQLEDTSTDRVANLVRRHRVLAVTISPTLGGPSRIYDDPAWSVVPLHDSPSLTIGLVWRERSAQEPAVAAALDAVRTAWRDRPLDLGPVAEAITDAPA